MSRVTTTETGDAEVLPTVSRNHARSVDVALVLGSVHVAVVANALHALHVVVSLMHICATPVGSVAASVRPTVVPVVHAGVLKRMDAPVGGAMSAVCVTATSVPATRTVPVRATRVVLGATVKLTVPRPLPELPLVTVIQSVPTVACAVHVHPVDAVTVSVLLPPAYVAAKRTRLEVYVHCGVAPPNAAARSMRGVTTRLRASVTRTPVVVKRARLCSDDSLGNALRSTATAPATCGVACDVPLMVMPAAVTCAPGASNVRNEALFEKHVTLSAAVMESEHAE